MLSGSLNYSIERKVKDSKFAFSFIQLLSIHSKKFLKKKIWLEEFRFLGCNVSCLPENSVGVE